MPQSGIERASVGCPCPTEPGGPRHPGQSPEVNTPYGITRFCPGTVAAVRTTDQTDTHPAAERSSGPSPLLLSKPLPEVIARFRRYGCPEYALAKWINPKHCRKEKPASRR